MRYRCSLIGCGVLLAVLLLPGMSHGQGFLDRLREQLQPSAPTPVPPPGLQPLAPGANANGNAFPTVALGAEVVERGTGVPYEVVIRLVNPGSAAESAGLRTGDVIVRVDSVPIGKIDDIAAAIRAYRPGDTSRVIARRGNQLISANATFPALPPSNPQPAKPAGEGDAPTGDSTTESATDPNRPMVVERTEPGSGRLGVTVENVSTTAPAAGVPVQRGAVVVGVQANSPAGKQGIRVGDVVVAIDGVVIQDAAALIEHMSKTKPGQTVEVSYFNGANLRRVRATLAGDDGVASASIGEPVKPTESGSVLGALGGALGGFFNNNPPESPAGTDPPSINSDVLTPDMLNPGLIETPAPSPESLPVPSGKSDAVVPPIASGTSPALLEELRLLREQVRLMQERINALEQQLKENN